MKLKLISIAVLVLAAVLPASALAHVTLQPDEAPAGGFARFDVRVPNERDNAATSKVEIELPDGFIFASYEPVAGWKVDVSMAKLPEPVESHGEPITEQVKRITWTATDPGAAIQPGQFRDFGLSVGLPETANEGDELTFPSIQTYDNGEVVRWIGAPDSEEPAPQVLVTAEEPEHGSSSGSEESSDESDDSGDGGAPTWLAILGVGLGGAGLGAGGLALTRGRRRSA
jgi:periplasmic copper chaperone A